ncbi:MAG: hypothetical protein KKA97_02685 [Actinobacteria bacterium]|jgi:hypothetical protein|nr:hypothetical protein [Actinomycetota bacterium]
MAQGKRAGARQKRGFNPALLLLALGVTASVVAWGYLVFAAVDFGGAARDGDGAAWGFLALASLGAVACLFLGLILLSRIARALGLTQPPPPRERVPRRDPDPPPGGHRGSH